MIKIECKFPSLNKYTQSNRSGGVILKNGKKFYPGNAMKKKYTDIVAWNCGKLTPCINKIDIHCTWHEKTLKRDKDNVAFGLKFIQDGLVKAGILKNDGWKNIENISHSFIHDKSWQGVEVILSEYEQ